MSRRELVGLVELVREVERRGVGGGVVVDDARAGQLLDEIGGRGEDLRGFGEDLRPVALQPQDLRPDRLRGQRVAAAAEQRVLADRARSVPRSPSRRACRRRRAPPFISGSPSASTGSMHGPMALAADRADVRRRDPAVGEQLLRDEGEVVPPVLARPVLGPAGLRHQHLVGMRRLRDDPARLVDQHALRFEGADVDAEIVLHCGKSSRSRLKLAVDPARPSTSKLGQADEVGEVADFQRGVRVAARESRGRSPRRPRPTSWT